MKKFSYIPLVLSFATLFVLSTFLVYADWMGPISNAPLCAAGNPGCDAPINVGSVAQTKQGALTVTGNGAIPGTTSIGDILATGVMQANQGEFFAAGTALNIPNGLTKTKGGLEIETRTSDPTSPAAGRLWLRTDL